MKAFDYTLNYKNGRTEQFRALNTAHPNLIITYRAGTRLRAYDVTCRDSGAAVARYLPTIAIARAVAGALSGLGTEFAVDDPRLNTKDAAVEAWGEKLVNWMFVVHNGLRAPRSYC